MPTFATVLQNLRRAARLSQEELAERARLSVETISALERGARRAPYRTTVQLLADGLALPASARQLLASAAASAARRGARRAHLDEPAAALPAAPPDDVASPPAGAFGRQTENLPQQRTSFIGREDVLVDVGALVRSQRLVTLVGPGGAGKTRTSLQIATEMLEAFADGVWFIELAELTNGDDVPAAVAHVLGIELSPAGALDTLVRSLRPKHALLIFDNCEHVVASAATVVAALLSGCPGVRVLATTRQTLGVAGESTYPLPALPFPVGVDALSTAEASSFAAVALFADRAAAADFGFALAEENALTIAEICRRLDGNPLAIELAAACMKFLSPQQLAERLDQRFLVLTRGNRDVSARHQTLRALIDWSYDLLDERERGLLRRLGVFAGSFTVQSAIAVGSSAQLAASDVLDVLASLIEKSLVLAESGNGERRYRLLESTRAYAEEKLAASGERDAVFSRHRRHLRDLFAGARQGVSRIAGRTEVRRLLTTESENVRSALNRPVLDDDVEVNRELLAALGAAWTRQPGIRARVWATIGRRKSRRPRVR
jgi:predicted ATPase/transcriptional regulator with XRE-family HTH domain